MPLFLPSTLPLFPIAPPHVLYPSLTLSLPIPVNHLSSLLDAIAQNAASHKASGESSRVVAVVPVVEIERRVGRWATAAKVKAVEKRKGEEGFTLILEGLARIRLPRSLPPVLSILPPLPLPISTYLLPISSPTSISPSPLLPLARQVLPSQLHDRLHAIPSSVLPDLLVTVLNIEWEHRVEILGLPDVDERSEKVREFLMAYMAAKGVTPQSTSRSSTAIIPRPAQSPPPSQVPEDLQPLHAVLQSRQSELTPVASQTALRELTRLAKIPAQSAEYGVGRTYVEWILALPWGRVSEMEEKTLEDAKAVLEGDHEGLEEVKKRVIEHLAVYRLKRELHQESLAQQPSAKKHGQVVDSATASDLLGLIPKDERTAIEQPSTPQAILPDEPPSDVFRDKGPILLLVGPPGVGKTSIARSLAAAMGRKFHRISLGGVRDEAEIRGHRRTYVGALPGRLVQGMRKVGVSNPVILLDELDKVGTSSFHGDPSAALLETLDPAQNWAFHDHYLGEIPLDLSRVLFIATANSLDTISAPLLDRCEVIECAGYATAEKLHIAKRFLLPKQITENGLDGVGVTLSDEGVMTIITEYTREAGVRSLERELAKVCRHKAVEYSQSRQPGATAYCPTVDANQLGAILGVSKFDPEVREEAYRPGVVTGLAYQGSGQGGILLIESLLVPTSSTGAEGGRLVMTGSLGEVISESAKLALTWVKARAVELGIGADVLQHHDIHMHFPAGAVKKDGPSAGVGMVLALVSLLTGKSMPSTIAVTGEITLRGAVTAVGGIKEKVLGAHRAGITKIIMPKRNRKDVRADLPYSVLKDVEMVYVERIDEALEAVWGRGIWATDRGARIEARL